MQNNIQKDIFIDGRSFFGVMKCLKHYNPNISSEELRKKIIEVLNDWSKETLNYWFDWFGLSK